MPVLSSSFRTFQSGVCVYELEPDLHQYIGMTREVIQLDIIIPMDWVGGIKNLWTSPESCCGEDGDHDESDGPYGYPCDTKHILFYNVHNPNYNIDETFPRGINNEFIERYRRELFKTIYNENSDVAQKWQEHIQDIINSINPFRFVSEEARNKVDHAEETIQHTCGGHFHDYVSDIIKVTEDLTYIPDVNELQQIWYSPVNSPGTNSLSKLINNINVGEMMDLLWNYFYHDYNSCKDDHLFDPYNTLNKDDELVFPIHIKSLFGYSDKVTLLTTEDDIIYEYHVNLRFKQNVQPEVIENPVLGNISKHITGEPLQSDSHDGDSSTHGGDSSTHDGDSSTHDGDSSTHDGDHCNSNTDGGDGTTNEGDDTTTNGDS